MMRNIHQTSHSREHLGSFSYSSQRRMFLALLISFGIVGLAISLGGCSSPGPSGVSPKSYVNDYSWAELSAISDEISAAPDEQSAIEIAKEYHLVNSDGKLDVSQSKEVKIAYSDTKVRAVVAGIYHDDKADGSGKAGITFILDAPLTSQVMNEDEANEGGWEQSQLRSWLSSEGVSYLPDDLQQELVPVTKRANSAGSDVVSASDSLWLFSFTELAGGNLNDIASEGSQYKLFRDMNVAPGTSNQVLARDMTLPAMTSEWWTRSPMPTTDDSFFVVDSEGDPRCMAHADMLLSVVPGFCL